MALIRLNNQSLTNVTALPSGVVDPSGVVQVKYVQTDDIANMTFGGSTTREVSQLTVSITPTSASNKILLQAMVMGEFASRTMNWNGTWFFMRDSTELRKSSVGLRNAGIAIGYISHESDNASTPEGVNYTYIDSPASTSALTYKVAHFSPQTAANFNLNHTVTDSSNSAYERLTSSIIAMEITT